LREVVSTNLCLNRVKPIRLAVHRINCPLQITIDGLDSMENDLTGSNWAEKIFGKRESHSPDDPCPDGMGNCSEVKDNASDFIDGEVSPTIATRLKHHLGICDNCDGWMASLAQTVGLLRQSPQHEVPESLRRKISQITKD